MVVITSVGKHDTHCWSLILLMKAALGLKNMEIANRASLVKKEKYSHGLTTNLRVSFPPPPLLFFFFFFASGTRIHMVVDHGREGGRREPGFLWLEPRSGVGKPTPISKIRVSFYFLG